MEGELFEQAATLFAEKGFAGTTLQDIANAMGLSRPSLYHYIQSKDELLERLVEDVTAAAAELVTVVADDVTLTADEKVRQTVRGMVKLIAEQPSRFRLLAQSETAMPAELARKQARLRRQVLSALVGIIDEGKQAGLFRPVDSRVAAFGVIGAWNWVAWWYRRGDRGEIAEQLADTAVHGLLADRSGSTSATSPEELFGLVREDLSRLEAVIKRERPS
jgi:AcrR family transcriptional regulator